MGQIKKIIHSSEISHVPHNNRMCIELCENVHLHYRNLRLEFSKEEFMTFLETVKSVDPYSVLAFNYSNSSFQTIADSTLPDSTQFNTRLQIELQTDNSLHIHYRNLRIEF